ncbi:MAG: hypothetical protein RLZ72_678 [Actinomycetota bacterium]|jgi:lipid II:glycine glycyltransferase (peptidoglycan interpeptide bridge formation enzyme)
MISVSEISAAQHLEFIRSRPSVSFLQTPAWGTVKSAWTSRSLGWFDDGTLVGTGLLLLRKVPRVEKYFGYLPEGPDLDWDSINFTEAMDALHAYLRPLGVFQVKMGPQVWTRRWEAETLKAAIAEGGYKHISDVAADHTNSVGTDLAAKMSAAGWTQNPATGDGFGDYQPRYVFQIGLEGKSHDELLTGFNQLWRRNIKKAEREGVTVRRGGRDDLETFFTCYVETAQRDKFSPRPLRYFHQMWDALSGEDPDRITLYIAEHPDFEGAIAATIMVRVGVHSWYSYGASSTAARDVKPSNAVQWQMMRDSADAGCSVYDMRGIANTLDPANHLFGLIQFKLGTGGYAQEYLGEWDFTLSALWARAFSLYMAIRR